MTDPDTLRQAIAAIEAQRAVLGDTVTELALAPLRQLLAQHDGPPSTDPTPTPQLRRAQVTVLFADIVESTALASRLDAEDVLQIFGAMLQRAAACVRARGGRVLRYTGDGLKAGFGTQGTREDDAVQAVLAGLDILAAGREHAEWVARQHGVQGFALRVGAHTGEVALGAGFEADNTLTGDTVNIAARMEQAAPPGALRISAETWAHVRGRFEAEAQPPLAVKGLDRPVATWLVRAASAGAVERGIQGLAVPMIGRNAERAQLRAAMEPAPERGLRAITVVADGGIGKTRLLREVLAEAPQARVLTVRAHPGAELRPWGLLHGLLSAHCGIADGDSADEARRKLVDGLAPELSTEAEAQAQRIGQLLGMDFGDVPALRGRDARALRDLAFAALLDWLAGLCRTSQGAAVVLVVEDLHWTDEASLDAITHWMDNASALPLTLLMSARPVLLERRPAWCERPPACTRLMLGALTETDRPALADALLQRIGAPPERLRTLLIEQAEGNPFYMEELLRRLLDDGAIRREGAVWQVDTDRLDKLRLPTTLVGLLQARLDALPPAERMGAQRASIVGHVFWDQALAQVDVAAASTLDALQRRQWVRQRASSAFEGTAERQFDHHLLHQVTYDTVLKEDRRRGHAAVAHWLADRTEGRAPEFMAITAEHAERAGEAALAATCYERAAREARARFANVQALALARKALRLLPEEAHEARWILLGLVYDIADVLADRAAQDGALQEKEALLARHPDPKHKASLLMSRSLFVDRTGDIGRSFELATQAATLADEVGEDDISAFAHSQLAWLCGQRGEHDQSRVHLAAALGSAARLRDTKPMREIQALLIAGIMDMRAFDFPASRRRLLQVFERAEACGEGRSQLGALHYLSQVSTWLCEHERALVEAQQLAELAGQMGNTMQQAVARYQEAAVLRAMGRAVQALATGLRACDALQQLRSTAPLAGCTSVIGHAHAALGQFSEAKAAFAAAHTLHEQMEPGSGIGLSRRALMAAQDLDLGDLAAAREGLEPVLAAFGLDCSRDVTEDPFDVHWACQRVLAAAVDARAPSHLQALQAKVRAQALRQAGSEEAAAALIGRSSLYSRILAAGTGGA